MWGYRGWGALCQPQPRATLGVHSPPLCRSARAGRAERRGAHLREHPRQPLLQEAAALPGPGARGVRCGGPRCVPTQGDRTGSPQPWGPRGAATFLGQGLPPNPLVPPNAGPGPQSSLGGPTERTVGGAPRPDALSWLRPLLGDGALRGGLGLPSLGWLTGGCFQGLEPPAMHRLTSWPQQRPTGRGLSTHGPGRSSWPRWSPRRRTRAEPTWPGSGDASLREVAS